MLLIERLSTIAERAQSETDSQFLQSVREFLCIGEELNAQNSPEPIDESLFVPF